MDFFDDDMRDELYEDGYEDIENDIDPTESLDDDSEMEDWMYFGMALGLGQEIGLNEAEIHRDLDELSQPLLLEKSKSGKTESLLPVKHDSKWAEAQIDRMLNEYDNE